MTSVENETQSERHPTWEVLAAIVGYVTSVEPAIYLIGHHLADWNKDAIPACWRITVAVGYGIVFFVVGSWTLYKFPASSVVSVAKDEILSSTDKAVRAMKRHRLLRIVRSFGLMLIFEWLLDRLGVTIYNSFNRYSDWEVRPDLFDNIDRYSLKEESIEFQYSRDYSFIEYRSGSEPNHEYGTPQKLNWKTTPHHWLTFFSWAGLRWTIFHLVLRRGNTEVKQ